MLPHEMLQTQTQVERSLLSRVMGWLALSLALTTGGIYLWIAGVVPQNIPWLLYFIVAIGLIFGIQAATNSKNQSLAVGLFGIFSVIEGLFIAPIVAYYLHAAPDAVGSALLGTVGIFLVAAAVVYLTSTFFDFWRVKAERAGDNNALLLALSLYLDFINLFLILLRIFGRRD